MANKKVATNSYVNNLGSLTGSSPSVGAWSIDTTTISSPVVYNTTDTVSVKGNIVIEGNDGSKIDVGETLNSIMDRLAIIQPNYEAMEEFVALRDAYEKYKMLEKLLTQGKKNGD